MQFKLLIALAATFMAASATPVPQDLGLLTGVLGGLGEDGDDAATGGSIATPTVQQLSASETSSPNSATCGNNEVMSCCNSGAGDASLLPIDPTFCSIPVLSIVAQTCENQTPACCTGNSDGTINLNVQCNPLSA